MICNPPGFYLPTWENFAPPYTSPKPAQNLFGDRFMSSSTLGEFTRHVYMYTRA